MMAILGLVLFAIMFAVAFVLRTVMQKRRTGDSGVRAGGLRSSIGSMEWLAGWLLVIALLTGVAAPGAELLGLDPWYDTTWIRGIGAAIAVVGIALTFASQLSMGDQWRIGVDATEETELVTHGAFTVIRNPIFGCMIVVATGLAVLVPNALSAVGLILLVVAIELQVRFVEEPHLRNLHADTYPAYASRVGRLVPGVGRG